MDQLTQVLLNLFSLSTAAPALLTTDSAHRPVLRLQHIDIMLSRLVAALAPAQAAQFEHMRAARTAEVGGATAKAIDLDSAAQLIGVAEALLRSVEMDPATLQRIAQAIDDITVLATAIRLNSLADVTISVNEAAFFDYVAELRFQSLDRRGHVLIVGRLHEDTLEVKEFAAPPILQKISLMYRKTSPDLELKSRELELGYRDKGVEHRDQWIQKDQPRWDLFVYKRFEAQPLLRIETRTQTDALSIALGALHIMLPVFDNLRLVVTSIISMAQSATTDKSTLVSYIRAF